MSHDNFPISCSKCKFMFIRKNPQDPEDKYCTVCKYSLTEINKDLPLWDCFLLENFPKAWEIKHQKKAIKYEYDYDWDNQEEDCDQYFLWNSEYSKIWIEYENEQEKLEDNLSEFACQECFLKGEPDISHKKFGDYFCRFCPELYEIIWWSTLCVECSKRENKCRICLKDFEFV